VVELKKVIVAFVCYGKHYHTIAFYVQAKSAIHILTKVDEVVLDILATGIASWPTCIPDAFPGERAVVWMKGMENLFRQLLIKEHLTLKLTSSFPQRKVKPQIVSPQALHLLSYQRGSSTREREGVG
jgi:hypothetical protein